MLAHAFYLGVELGRAEIAHRLGKRYTQDRPLAWGCAVPPVEEDTSCYAPAASTKVRRGDDRGADGWAGFFAKRT